MKLSITVLILALFVAEAASQEYVELFVKKVRLVLHFLVDEKGGCFS
jgi:hypothetical protein